MRFRKRFLFIYIFLVFCVSQYAQAKVDTVRNAAQLYSICARGEDSLDIVLLPGDYHLAPNKDVDTMLSMDGDTNPVKITYGLKITSKFVNIKGAAAYGSAIYTHSGYGLWFVGCENGVIEGIIISGGIRDSDSRATDAAIVASNSKLRILDNLIFENQGDTGIVKKNVVGIMGICVREKSYVFIYDNQIARNSWHGIGVYKDGAATITGNLIDGVDKAKDEEMGGGRGIGILITRNGKATVETNIIKRYSKGIGVFINADALVSENLVEDVGIWGINVWDADSGRPVARINKNIIYKTGACGVAIIRYLEGKGETGFFTNNIMVETAQNHEYDSPDKYCFQCALAVHARPDKFTIEGNVFYKNTWMAPCFTNLDKGIAQFVEILQTQYSTVPLQWYAGYSEFIQ
ncbi:MAG: right-handed parallel beta-helix repeat-containing protein, partial [Sphingobacteriales bacterium]